VSEGTPATDLVVKIGGTAGLIEGNVGQMGVQALSIIVTIAWSAFATAIILLVLKSIPGLGLRAPEGEEDQGLDVSLHGERAVVHDGAD
jgi:ammonium transporter, Amt family